MVEQPPPGGLPEPHIHVSRKVRHPREVLIVWISIPLAVIIYVGGLIVIFTDKDASDYLSLLAIIPLLILIGRAFLYAGMRASGVRITPAQFPEAHAMIVEAAQLYRLKRLPEGFVLLGNGMINAFASGHGRRRFVVFYSDLFEVGGRLKDPETFRFILAHEVGHIAAGHTSYWRFVLMAFLEATIVLLPLARVLSRSQEYSADNYGYATCPSHASSAMCVLASGKYLYPTVDFNQIADRAKTDRGFFVWLVNFLSTHPILIRRASALRDRSKPGRLLW